jgi:hypothetical protein
MGLPALGSSASLEDSPRLTAGIASPTPKIARKEFNAIEVCMGVENAVQNKIVHLMFE